MTSEARAQEFAVRRRPQAEFAPPPDLAGITAAILAGGPGTRLRPVVSDRPKALAPVHDRPYLTYLLDWLADNAVRDVVLLTGHQADQVRRTLGETYRDLRLIHSAEPSPLGTGGALRRALPHLVSPVVLVLNGDSWCDVDLADFRVFHARKADRLSLVLAVAADAARYGRVQVAADGRVQQFGEKDEARGGGWINAGIYLMDRGLIEEIPDGGPVSLERDLLPSWLGRRERIHGYFCTGRFLDIGTPESYAEAATFFQAGAGTPEFPRAS
jgi:D-glycero-alpha-D-manno-heptose 1-phosphate guanylyltransferase